MENSLRETLIKGIFLIGFSIIILPNQGRSDDNTKSEEDYSGTKIVQMDGETYELPYKYIGNFYRSKPNNYLKRYVVNVDYPSFSEGYPNHKTIRIKDIRHIKIHFLPMIDENNVRSGFVNVASFERILKLTESRLPKNYEAVSLYGLEGYKTDSGMALYSRELWGWGRIHNLILCSTGAEYYVKIPLLCKHHFLSPELNLAFEAHYLKANLVNWKDIESRSISLISAFRQKN